MKFALIISLIKSKLYPNKIPGISRKRTYTKSASVQISLLKLLFVKMVTQKSAIKTKLTDIGKVITIKPS